MTRVKSATLYLEDGSCYEASLFGAAVSTSGEVGKNIMKLCGP